MKTKGNLKEVATVFLKLGMFAFGGPAAHIAMMEDEVVSKRKWMTREHFLDLMGATNLIPGPNSTEMTMHCGHERAGWKGLFVAGISFIFPAVVFTTILAYLYVSYGKLPQIEPFLYGIKPAVIAIILSAIYKLGNKALKNWQLAVIGMATVIASVCGINEITIILLGGFIGLIWLGVPKMSDKKLNVFAPAFLISSGIALTKTVTNAKLFFVFLKVGAILFGSGYVLVAYLDAELVEKLGWLTKSELLDAIAIGQFTPGPVLSTASFVGYQINGIWGALVATLGIFLPSFIFVLVLNPIVPKLRKSKLASGFLDAVNISAVGIMIGVTYHLSEEILINWQSITIAIISMVLVFYYKKLNAFWIVIIGAILGYILYQLF
ncbi:chromate efflux transporter [Kordia sp. YSTF-M3]|uniref:Chromate efflux transporter n=1 Tax=Kordia aestuariivivens TaxID=2759037 RepID=A0ABR7QFA4_9FLAO|nr:chromate efflux transporter [Kordia aestuariivivens]MBC8757103.1 chromate efflux transporter [Kordia aestuariivivens]